MSATGAEGQALHAVPEVATEKQTIAQAVRDAMLEEMERDDRVIVLGEDVGVDGGVFRDRSSWTGTRTVPAGSSEGVSTRVTATNLISREPQRSRRP